MPGGKREALRLYLAEAGIASAVFYPIPMHKQKPYLKGAPKLPESERAAAEVLSLPIFPELSAAQQGRVVDAIRGFYGSLNQPPSSLSPSAGGRPFTGGAAGPLHLQVRLEARGLAWCLDLAGQLILGGEPHGVDWAHQDRIAVLRLDHLGDLLHALPALRRLRLVSPRARIDLWVGPWGQELASLFADVDTVRVTPAGWFARPRRQEWPWKQIWSLASGLNKEHYSAAVELRGDLRHHMALRLAGIPVRAGQSLTAGNFLLTHPAVWQPDLHEQEQGLSVLDGAWVPSHEQGEDPLPEAARQCQPGRRPSPWRRNCN